ncbi:MAG: CAP domain-containing protein [Solirubrobacterales bacterium]
MATIAAGLLAAPGPASAASSSGCPNADAMPLSVSTQAFNDSILCLLNRERTNHGLGTLRINAKLTSAAIGHSVSMRSRGYFEHDEPGGATFAARIQAIGYTQGAKRWLAGENLGWGTNDWGTPQSLMVAWMDSPLHRANILEPRFREIGIGLEWGSPQNPTETNAALVTTDFGYAKKRHKRHRRH